MSFLRSLCFAFLSNKQFIFLIDSSVLHRIFSFLKFRCFLKFVYFEIFSFQSSHSSISSSVVSSSFTSLLQLEKNHSLFFLFFFLHLKKLSNCLISSEVEVKLNLSVSKFSIRDFCRSSALKL